MSGHPALTVDPMSGRVDSGFAAEVSGLGPGTEVTIGVEVRDGARSRWSSRNVFRADDRGVVDTRRDAPLPGSDYAGVDPWGVLWSVRDESGSLFVKARPTPLTYRLSAVVDGREVAAVDGVRRHFGDGVRHQPVDRAGVVGSLHRPDRDGRWPAVVVLGGSDGGLLEHAASLLADEGFTVLALAYFGVEDLPPHLAGIELDELDAALSWLAQHPAAEPGGVALVGMSRGAELALQLAADNPLVGPVVAIAPSALRQPGLTGDYTDFTMSAWLRSGEPLPFNPGRLTILDRLRWLGRVALRRPMRQVDSFLADLADPVKVDRAAIAVEHCRGPLLLVSGEDDQLWPSARFADLVVERMAAHGRGDDVTDLRYPGVGHFVGFPYSLPGMPPGTTLRPTSFLTVDFGGQPAAHAHASRDSWDRIRRFLRARHRPHDHDRDHDRTLDPAREGAGR